MTASPHRGWLLAGAMAALAALRLWVTPVFPTQDGPSHLYNAMVLRSLLVEGAASPFADWMRLVPDPMTSWFAGALLMVLMEVLPAAAAEQALLTLAVAGVPLAGAWLARALGAPKGSEPVAAAVLAPFALNYFCAMGFHAFALSLPLWMVLVARWLEPRSPGPGYLAEAAMALLLWLLHPVSVAAWLLVALLLAGARVLGSPAGARGGCLRCEGARLAAAAALPVGLMLGFAVLHGGGEVRRLSTAALAETVLLLRAVRNFGWGESVVALPLAAGAAAVLARAGWRGDRGLRPVAMAAGLFLVLALALPDRGASGSYIVVRLTIFAWLLAAASLPAVLQGTRWGALLLPAGLVVLGLQWAFALPRQHALAEAAVTVRALGTAISEGAVLLAFPCSEHGRDGSGRPLGAGAGAAAHLGAWVALDRRAVHLNNYEAWQGHFPVHWLPEVNPLTHMSRTPRGMKAFPPKADIAAWEARTGRAVEYVLVLFPGSVRDGIAAQTLRDVEEGYDRVAVSRPPHVAEVWRRR